MRHESDLSCLLECGLIGVPYLLGVPLLELIIFDGVSDPLAWCFFAGTLIINVSDTAEF